MVTVERYHDISMGHRVVGHEGKCKHLHGHNYRITFVVSTCVLDQIGRVVDFSVIKSTLCQWLEDNWDHKMVLWEQDEIFEGLYDLTISESCVYVPFNPTAENIAKHLVEVLGPALLPAEVKLVECRVEETRKCSATYAKG